MNEPIDTTGDAHVIARVRSALDEVTAGPVAARPRAAEGRGSLGAGRWLAIAAAIVLIGGGITAIVVNRNHHAATPADSTPLTPTVPTEPTLIRTVVPQYVLNSPDLFPAPVTSQPNPLIDGELSLVWARGGDPADAFLVVRAGESSSDITPYDTSLAEYRMVGSTAFTVASYGLGVEERLQLVDQIVPGSGLPWVLPVDGWTFLGLGTRVDGASEVRAYSSQVGTVTLAVGPLVNQFVTLAAIGNVEPVVVAGRAGWRATNSESAVVLWPAGDSNSWASMVISAELVERTDGLIAAVSEVPQDDDPTVDGGPDPVVDTVPVPLERRYQGVASVIDTGNGPMIAFSVMESLPPQGGDIPLAGFDWSMIDGEQSLNGTTWSEGSVLLTGTFDGTTFTLTEPATNGADIEWPVPLSHDTITADCTLEDMAPGLDLLGSLDLTALGILSTSSDNWDGRCGVEVYAAFDTPELREALAPLGDQVTVTIAFLDVTD